MPVVFFLIIIKEKCYNINGENMENKKTKKEIVKLLLKQELNEDNEKDLMELLFDSNIAIDVEKQEDAVLTFGDKIADKISSIAGSWTFIILFTAFLIGWMILNTFILTDAADPYPFILLNLILSCIAALQAPIIMMSQNRQAKKDTLRNQNDYLTDLKSELILEVLHDQINVLAKNQNIILKYIEEEKNKTVEK